MVDSGDRDLAYHHSEIARLKASIGSRGPNSHSTGFVPARPSGPEGVIARRDRLHCAPRTYVRDQLAARRPQSH